MRWRWTRESSPAVPTSSDGWIDPSQLLYSLPTICDELPGTTEEAARPEDVLLHEDDWRQVELVAAGHARALAENLAAIREIRAEQPGLGFARIHVREEPRLPLLGLGIRREDLVNALGSSHRERTGVAFESGMRRIEDAFAYVGPGSTVYGVEVDGRIETLGIHVTSSSVGPDLGVAALRDVAEQHGACLVDWVGGRSYPDVTEL